MAKESEINQRYGEAFNLSQEIQSIHPLFFENEQPFACESKHEMQMQLIYQAFEDVQNLESFLAIRFEDSILQGLSRKELLIELTSALLARRLALREKQLYKSESKISFYVHDAGIEIPHLALNRKLSNQDAFSPYYRAQTIDLQRGGTIADLLALDLQKKNDLHSGSRQLAGHVASSERSILPVLSMTGTHVPASVGIAAAIKDREYRPESAHWSRFSRADAISVATIGESTMAQECVIGAVGQAVKDQVPWLLAVIDNGMGISMGHKDSTINGDPLAAIRGFEGHGLNIREVSAANLLSLFSTSTEIVEFVRNSRTPAVLLIKDVPRITDHTSSSVQDMYIPPSVLSSMLVTDVLPKYIQFLIEHDVLTKEQVSSLDSVVREDIEINLQHALSCDSESGKNLYHHTYAPIVPFHPKYLGVEDDVTLTPMYDAVGTIIRPGVDYSLPKKTEGPLLTMRQYTTLTLARAMRRYPEMVVFGEDVATVTTDFWEDLEGYFFDMLNTSQQHEYHPNDIELAAEYLMRMKEGKGYDIPPAHFALLGDVLKGKGGVFKNTSFLQLLYGNDRVFNFRITEEEIIGNAIGRALAGQLAVVEIQFGSYLHPAFSQLVDQLATLRWRSNGQFYAPVVIRIQGMNRIGGDGGILRPGGVGGIGHGDAEVTRLRVPGLLNYMPAEAAESGPMLAEAIDVAAEWGQPIVIWEPISQYNSSKSYDQGPYARIPLGEPQVRKSGKDITLITWSNNIVIADKVAADLSQEGVDAGVINLRSLDPDWSKIVAELLKSKKILIFESGRGKDSEHIEAFLNGRFQEKIKIKRLQAREYPMPAGSSNEAYTVPQYQDVLSLARKLARYKIG